MKSGLNNERRGLLKSGMVVAAALAALLALSMSAYAFQDAAAPPPERVEMHTYVIERTIPGAGDLTAAQLRDISQKSDQVLKDMGPDIQWVDSFVTKDKIYCIYRAKNADLVREHAKRGGFPADSVNEVTTMIDPSTGN